VPISKTSDNDRNFEHIIRPLLILVYKRHGITSLPLRHRAQNDKCMNDILGLILFGKPSSGVPIRPRMDAQLGAVA
jgi:hypothetical protein